MTDLRLYLLDEPTTGLHFDDVRKLLEVLHRLADLGNSVIIIEHNLDVIRNADWILDLGPEGGEDGGHIVGQGRPIKIAATPGSYTGQFLKRYYTSSSGRLEPVGLDDESARVDSAGSQGAPSVPRLSAEGAVNNGFNPEDAQSKQNKPTGRKNMTTKKTTPKKSASRRKKTVLP